MPTNDLSSIPGLERKYLQALAKQHVTDLRSLADADPGVLYRTLGNFRPRPEPKQISRWQDEARTRLQEAATNSSDWHRAASFMVMFMQHRVGDRWERRVEVEHTEVEPERPTESWPGWDCAPACRWMRDQLGLAESAGPESANGTDGAQAQPVGEPTGSAERPAGMEAVRRPPLRIDSAAVIDATGRVDVVVGGAMTASPPAELVAPVRVVLAVSGAEPKTGVLAVTRILRSGDTRGWNPQDPVDVPTSGQAEFDLSRVPAGQHTMALIAWAPDATEKPASVTLPTVTIRRA